MNLTNLLVLILAFSSLSFAQDPPSLADEAGHHEEKGRHEEGGHHEEGEHHGHHGHGGGKAIGEGKAIVEVDEEKGFVLSREARETIGVRLTPVNNNVFTIPKEALVVSQDKVGVYRQRSSFFKMIPVVVIKEEKDSYTVKVGELRAGDQVAIEGVGILRVSDIYSTDKSEYGHAH
ncbi:MAG: hypothetical protein WD025_07015 [Bacteriovoracaceae bacterium]